MSAGGGCEPFGALTASQPAARQSPNHAKTKPATAVRNRQRDSA